MKGFPNRLPCTKIVLYPYQTVSSFGHCNCLSTHSSVNVLFRTNFAARISETYHRLKKIENTLSSNIPYKIVRNWKKTKKCVRACHDFWKPSLAKKTLIDVPCIHRRRITLNDVIGFKIGDFINLRRPIDTWFKWKHRFLQSLENSTICRKMHISESDVHQFRPFSTRINRVMKIISKFPFLLLHMTT